MATNCSQPQPAILKYMPLITGDQSETVWLRKTHLHCAKVTSSSDPSDGDTLVSSYKKDNIFVCFVVIGHATVLLKINQQKKCMHLIVKRNILNNFKCI